MPRGAERNWSPPNGLGRISKRGHGRTDVDAKGTGPSKSKAYHIFDCAHICPHVQTQASLDAILASREAAQSQHESELAQLECVRQDDSARFKEEMPQVGGLNGLTC